MSARSVIAVAAGVVVATAGCWSLAAPDAAGGSTGPAAGEGGTTYGEPQLLCTVEDDRLPEISGAAFVGGSLAVANDKGARYYRLDGSCGIDGVGVWEGPRPTDGTEVTALDDRDVEDVAVGPDGTVWLVDSGGNRTPRTTVSLLGLTPEGGSVEIVFAYPSGTHDAEAAVVTPDLRLVLLTKETGRSSVYTARIPAPDPDAVVTGPVPLEPAGEIDLRAIADPATGAGGQVVTGAALGPDGRHVAVRTGAEIFEWSLDGTDLAAELVAERPARVARVEQIQGEGLVYSADGDRLLALSEQLPSPVLAIDVERVAQARTAPSGSGVPGWGYGLLGGAAGALLLVLAAGWRRRTPGPAPAGGEPDPSADLDRDRDRVPAAAGREGAR